VNRADPAGTDTVYNFPGLTIIYVPVVNMSDVPDRALLNNLRIDGLDSNNVQIRVRPYIAQEVDSVSVTTDHSLRRSHTDSIGGREIRLAPGSGARTQKHEFGHSLGAGDQYRGGGMPEVGGSSGTFLVLKGASWAVTLAHGQTGRLSMK
jgi:hypothetical protein